MLVDDKAVNDYYTENIDNIDDDNEDANDDSDDDYVGNVIIVLNCQFCYFVFHSILVYLSDMNV